MFKLNVGVFLKLKIFSNSPVIFHDSMTINKLFVRKKCKRKLILQSETKTICIKMKLKTNPGSTFAYSLNVYVFQLCSLVLFGL